MSRRVAVTGVSAITAIGVGREANWQALKEAKPGIGPITRFSVDEFRVKIAAEVKGFNSDDYIDAKKARIMELFSQYAVAGAQEALIQSGLLSNKDSQLDDAIAERAGCVIGCGLGGLGEIEAQMETFLAKGERRISPFFIPKVISNLAPGHISIEYNLKGPNFVTTSACTSGAHAIGESFRMIRNGFIDIAVTGGTESVISPLAVGGFSSMRALSTRNDDPAGSSRPFDKARDGFVMGEGSGILVLEEWEHAKKRGAEIIAELVGYGANSDAYHMTAPSEDGSGAAGAMRLAMQDAKISPAEIQLVNAHATSTGLGDISESKAIRQVFGSSADKVLVTSTKSMVGHCLGAAGGVEAVYTILGLQHQVAVPTINLENQDEECNVMVVANEARDLKHDFALSNSFGFGGTNASLIFRRAM